MRKLGEKRNLSLISRFSLVGVAAVGMALGHSSVSLGPTFAIVEPDLLRTLQHEAAEAWSTAGWTEAVRAYTKRPRPVAGLSRTVTRRTWMIDPSVVASRDIVTPDKTVLVRAGTRYNPLALLKGPLEPALGFYDGDDPDQVRWVQHAHCMPILVRGSVPAARRALARGAQAHRGGLLSSVYFDQEGRLTTRFHIQHVPARVRQVGLRLQVEECVP